MFSLTKGLLIYLCVQRILGMFVGANWNHGSVPF